MFTGLTHIYYGDGKGKSTAAFGLALRAAGTGLNVVIVQFLKDWNCGEIKSFELLPNITVFRAKLSGNSFYHEMNDGEKEVLKTMHNENLIKALGLHENGKCDVLILDEVIDAYNIGALDAGLFDALLKNKPEALELVITGHNPNPRILEYADYITEMVKRKHPYDKGITARKGIEF